MLETRNIASPYANNPVQVAEAFVAGREASTTTTNTPCPYTAGTNEFEAWHRGLRVGTLFENDTR